MKKLLIGTVLGLSLVSNSLFAKNMNNQNEIYKSKIEKIFNTLGKKFPGFKTTKVITLEKNQNLNDIYMGIEKIETNKDADYMLFFYYPKINAIQVINPASFRLFTDKKPYIYIDQKFLKIFGNLFKLKQELRKQKLKKQKKEILSKISKKNFIISLNKDKKETLLIFVDPQCPFCKREINNPRLEKLTDKYNVVFILTPLTSIHPHSMAISSKLAEDIKDNMSKKEKIKIIRKYFNLNQEQINKIDNKLKNQKIINNYNLFLKEGIIQGTPTIVKLNKKETKEFFNKLK